MRVGRTLQATSLLPTGYSLLPLLHFRHMHFFIPGTHPELSKAELIALDPSLSFSVSTDEVLVGELSRPAGEVLNASAGIVKAGVIFSAVETYDKKTIASILAATIEPGRGKLHIGVSVYDGDNATFRDVQKDSSRLGLELKSFLKESGRSVRLVTSREPTLSTVVVQKNHLLKSGVEFVLVVTPEKILLGETTFVQDFEAWGTRDYGRPARDAKSGMLPPKLARLMVNLTQVNPKGTRLWDPFCGSGTILMEAALLGCTQIVGSDLSEKAVADTERNMRWLEHHEKTGSEVTTLVHDAREPLPEELGTFELIVAEGYLGPSRRLNPEEASREIEELYQESLPQILSKLNASGTAIIAIPFFQTGQKKQFLHIETPKGFTMERGLLYARPHQRIGREILKLRRK